MAGRAAAFETSVEGPVWAVHVRMILLHTQNAAGRQGECLALALNRSAIGALVAGVALNRDLFRFL
jgi:hypothetical protein